MRHRSLLAFGLAAAALVGTSCSDARLTEPGMERPPLAAFFDQTTAPGMTALRRTVPLARDVSVTREFDDDDGGWLKLEEAGISVFIPEGAVVVDDEVEITLTALAGEWVAFEFAPHGIEFATPLRIRIDVADTEAEYLLHQNTPNGPLDDFFGVYWEGDSGRGKTPLESFPVSYRNGRLLFETSHFSGYAIASG